MNHEKEGYDYIIDMNKKKIFLKILLVLFFIFIILNEKVNLLLIYSTFNLKDKNKYKNIFNNLNNIKFNYKIKGIKYLNKCLKKKIIKKNNDIMKFPKISIIIPVYNCQNTIKMSIKSIQYQKMDEYEIIIILGAIQ